MSQGMLEIVSLSKRYVSAQGDSDSVRAVVDVSFSVGAGEFFTLLGPSGCGKTTTLRSIAGLETPDAGLIRVDGKTMFDAEARRLTPPNRRPLGMVFQSYAVWPHMSVRKNVSFPLEALPRRQRPRRSAVNNEVERVLDLVGLTTMIDRPATKLSGGQQQRLALARALIRRPAVLLLDEPLSNLDAKLRDSLRFELSRLQRETGQTVIYVTHDQGEALALSSRVAIMQDGHVAQIGTPREIYDTPVTRFVAEFVGNANFFSGTVTSNGAVTRCMTAFGELAVAVPDDPSFPIRQELTLAIRPECVELACEERPEGPWLEAVVEGVAYQGDATDLVCRVRSERILVRVHGGRSFVVNDAVWLRFAPGQTRVVGAEGRE